MNEDAAIIELPDGSPGAVSDAGSSMQRVAGGFERAGSTVARASSTVGAWEGRARVSFDGRIARYGLVIVAVEQALSAARGAVRRYETALEEARTKIRGLREQEQMAVARLTRAKGQLEVAQGRLESAQGRMSAVSLGASALEPYSMAEQAQAGRDAADAQDDIDVAQKQIDSEREEIRDRRNDAKRERTKLVEAEQGAAAEVRAAAAQLPDVQLPGGAASPSAYAGTIFASPISPMARDPRWASAMAKASLDGKEDEDKPWYEDAAGWTVDQISGLGKGAVEGVVGIAQGGAMLYRLSPTNALLNTDSFENEWRKAGQAGKFAWENPGEFGKAVVNWEDLSQGRYGEWLGNLGPDVVLAVGTAGAGTAASRGLGGAKSVGELGDAAKLTDRVGVQTGQTVYRLHGYNEGPGGVKPLEGPTTPGGRSIPSGADPWGKFWTDVDPFDLADPRNELGLPTGPDGNPARFLSVGELRDLTGVMRRQALPLDGNAGRGPELLIPDAELKIKLKGIYGLNPEP